MKLIVEMIEQNAKNMLFISSDVKQQDNKIQEQLISLFKQYKRNIDKILIYMYLHDIMIPKYYSRRLMVALDLMQLSVDQLRLYGLN